MCIALFKIILITVIMQKTTTIILIYEIFYDARRVSNNTILTYSFIINIIIVETRWVRCKIDRYKTD